MFLRERNVGYIDVHYQLYLESGEGGGFLSHHICYIVEMYEQKPALRSYFQTIAGELRHDLDFYFYFL